METNNITNILEILKLEKILVFFIGVACLIAIVRVVNKWSRNIYERFPNKRLLTLQIATIISFFIYILGTSYLFYFTLRPKKELLLTIGGSLAVAIGFALKDIVSSLFAGFILLFDRPFQVGDRVSYENIYGEIQSIGLRAVRLNTLDDNLVTIPNSKFITDAVASGNAGQLDMMVVVKFHISLDESIDKVKKIIHEVAITSRFIYLVKPINIVLEETEVAGRLAMRLTLKSYVLDARFEKAFQTDLVERVSEEFQKNNIKRPVFHL